MDTMLFCQSCLIPLLKEEDYGEEQGGVKNQDFCIHCYKEGDFVNPELTMEDMVEKFASFHEKMHITHEEAKKIALKSLPHMKRWRKKRCCCKK